MDAPGARVVARQVAAPAVGSAMATLETVVVPVFLTRNVQVILSPRSVLPSPLTSLTAADLVSWRAAEETTTVVVEELLDVTVAPAGFLVVAVAVLLTAPASTSAWVMT